jgi:hypothetical protein
MAFVSITLLKAAGTRPMPGGRSEPIASGFAAGKM